MGELQIGALPDAGLRVDRGLVDARAGGIYLGADSIRIRVSHADARIAQVRLIYSDTSYFRWVSPGVRSLYGAPHHISGSDHASWSDRELWISMWNVPTT